MVLVRKIGLYRIGGNMKSWTPLWSTIVTSTLWSESKDVRILFVTLLALKDADGVVMGTTVGLARLANLQYEECAKALKVLEGPDKRSDTLQEFDGRRIEKVEGGWRILNHAKYREMIQTIKRREYQRQKQAEYREKRKRSETNPMGPQHPTPGELSYLAKCKAGTIDPNTHEPVREYVLEGDDVA